MKKIWICGAQGMLGSHFRRLLDHDKTPYLATDVSDLDITNLDLVLDFIKTHEISHIINCAAYTLVDKAETEENKAYLINAIGPFNLARAAKQSGARLIHFSTDYVFDGLGIRPYKENHCCSPINVYGLTKLGGEIKILDEHEQACIIRTSWLFGYPGNNFVNTMIKLMKERESLNIVVDQVGRPTYCEDLARASLKMLDAQGIYHFANSEETNWYDFAREIHAQINEMGIETKVQTINPIPASNYPTPAKRPAYSTLDTKKIEKYLKEAPRNWKKALNEYLLTHKDKIGSPV